MFAWIAMRTGVQLPSPPASAFEARRKKTSCHTAVIPVRMKLFFDFLFILSLTSATRSKAVVDRQDWHERNRRRHGQKQSGRRYMALSSFLDQQGATHHNRSQAAVDGAQYPLVRHGSHFATCRTAP